MSEDSGEDSPPRSKRKIKKILILSGSSSESDESISQLRMRKKRLRVVSDAESEAAHSSGSSIVGPKIRRRPLQLLESDSDSESSHSSLRKIQELPSHCPTQVARGFSSDSSEGNSDKCSICLMRFTNQEVGTPQNCEHVFCVDCITEWSKNVNTCPVDRSTFEVIIVRERPGGRVLRKEPVHMQERRPSVELMPHDDTTICEICGSSDDETTMLLCDNCDLGFHMQCLTPPLQEIPAYEWYCPTCSENNLDDLVELAEVQDLIDDSQDIERPLGPRPSTFRNSGTSRSRRSTRNRHTANEPSTSRERQTTATPNRVRGHASTMTASITTPSSSRTRPRRRYKRRRKTHTVIIEYEVEDGGKIPIKKTVSVKKRLRRRVLRRRTRTAARRSHVRASVRAQLAALASASVEANASSSVRNLALNRDRAGVPALRLFGDPNALDYFSDDETTGGNVALAVAVRAPSAAVSTYRHARRKGIMVPSPPPASTVPDILSSILESQTLLHSKNSVVSVAADGRVDIEMRNGGIRLRPEKQSYLYKEKDSIDLSQSEGLSKQAPSYPGQSRGGGWSGNYRGQRPRDYPTGRGGSGGYGGYGADCNRPPHYRPHGGSGWRDDHDSHTGYMRRINQYTDADSNTDRDNVNRRQNVNSNRGLGHFPSRYPERGRPSWPPYSSEQPAPSGRHSFSSLSADALDMRTAVGVSAENNVDLYGDIDPPRREPAPQPAYDPLPEPPIFTFDRPPDVDKSEDEKSDSGLVIDTDKYDPTEPTRDDSSGDDEKLEEGASQDRVQLPPPPPSSSLSQPPPPPSPPPVTQQLTCEMSSTASTSSVIVKTTIFNKSEDLEERNWGIANQIMQEHDKSDNESEGDCPNFSIYSATSVHIASNTSITIPKPSLDHQEECTYPPDEDLVQEDDDTPTRDELPIINSISNISEEAFEIQQTNTLSIHQTPVIKKNEIDYNEKVSKRCPITPNPRTPIKIKLNTPSLIKRQVLDLYDDDEAETTIDTTVSTGDHLEHKPTDQEDINASLTLENVIKSNKEHQQGETNQIKDTTGIQPEKSNKETNESQITELKRSKLYEKEEEEEVSQNVNKQNSAETIDFVLKSTDAEDANERISPIKPVQNIENKLEQEKDDLSDNDLEIKTTSSEKEGLEARDEALEKMTESISETEDERSYTPCLDENKSNKDASFEIEKDNKGIGGLDTEMISDEEANEMFSDNDKNVSERSVDSPRKVTPLLNPDDVEVSDKKKRLPAVGDETRKKKKKESKKESKDKAKGKNKKNDVAFKKLSKSGKERNYRDKDKKDKEDKSKNKKERLKSIEKDKNKLKKKEKRKDLERYDVRTVVSEKRRKLKDPFGRDISPRGRSRSPSIARSPLERPIRDISPQPFRRSRSALSASPGASPSIAHRRFERSSSRRRRKSPSLRARRSRSRSRRPKRSVSPRRRSASPRRRRSGSRGRKRVRRDTSGTPKPKSRKKKRSRSKRRSTSRAASFVKEKKLRRNKRKSRSPRKKSPKQKRTKVRSVTPELELSPERRHSEDGVGPGAWPDKSPLYRGWSRSLSRSVNSRLLSPGWTPPRDLSPEPRHLRVILSNDDGARTKDRRRRQRDLEKHRHAKHTRDITGPSKEVFTSGDNILVSVSFNKKDHGETIPIDDSTGKHRKRKNDSKKDRREKKRKKGTTATDAANTKPVAIIDLERSPFREITPSPKNVIVLSDSDHGDKDGSEMPLGGGGDIPPADRPVTPVHRVSPAAGPKTPPEPSIKFSIAPKPSVQLRPVNPLREHDESREEHSREKGPNTPPEPPDSPPSSADAYDPFEPTRSRSASASPTRTVPPPDHRPPTTITLETAQKTNLSADDVVNQRPISPMEKVMALLHSTRDVSPTNIDELNRAPSVTEQIESTPVPAATQPILPAASIAPTTQSPSAVQATAQPVYLSAALPRVGVFSGAPSPQRGPTGQRIVLPSPTKSSPIRPQQPKLFLAKPSPIKSNPIKPLQSTKISKLPLPAMKTVGVVRKQPTASADDDLGAGLDSPYSPGSSDFGDLFEPPADATAPTSATASAKTYSKPTKGDLFDSLLGGKSSKLNKSKTSATKVPVKQIKKVPKKLNRQERVVEEVKLVLKPHYYKKRVTKEEYKDIMRRAVPKICHNKSGEINPTKIQALVEAYVRKFRKRHKLGLA
ncbi:PHD and RING finger domain-containing protein 1 [Eumeta japonica]|uniref:PHD and RING finger domain-containing protein 1 n=1 Tax=Eumeta variegata TaxID=151549 RepID=A0A4C1WAT9_EUMVA|nr:PHD and RING finger domain-containing protein 1 [Eumeta japonica]